MIHGDGFNKYWQVLMMYEVSVTFQAAEVCALRDAKLEGEGGGGAVPPCA